MIDKSLFPRLRRLFSTGIVVRNIGSKTLKVSDVDKLQAFSTVQSNSLMDKFTRIHRGSANNVFNPNINYQTLRYQLYTDYEAMDTDGIIASVLDIVAAECTIKGENNEVLGIRSTNEKVQSVLYSLFYDVLNIDFNLPMWIRSMCLHEDTKVPMLDGTEVSIKRLSEMYIEEPNKPLWVYSVQEGTNKIVPGRVKWCGLTRKDTDIVRVTLDDDTYIDVTPDHKFIMRDGSKKEAVDLVAGESLMPFYTKNSEKDKDCIEGYEKIYNPKSNNYVVTHRMVSHECKVRNIKEEVLLQDEFHTHHIDFNKKNNTPENLIRMKKYDHLKLHTDLAKNVLWGNDEVIEKRKKGIDKWLRSDRRRQMMSENMSETYPKYFKEYNSSELHKQHNVIRSENMKKRYLENINVLRPVSIVLDINCINFIKEYIIKQGNYVCISDLCDYLKNDNTFNILYKTANLLYAKNLSKSFYTQRFSELIYNITGLKYHEFVRNIIPNVIDTDIYKRMVGIHSEKSLTNHKVKSVVHLNEKSDTYCLEVVGPEGEEDRHNFAICSYKQDGTYSRNGIFVSNCKYGDCFLKMDIKEIFGVVNVRPLSVYEMQREEGMDPDNEFYIRYIKDPVALAGGSQSTGKDKVNFENFEIAHFRLLNDMNYLPYGRSYLEPARKYYKQYTMMLDAMLLHRIMRAPEKRIFYIDVGNIAPNEVNAFVQATINTMKKTPYVDPATGDYNLKFNIQNMTEDFYIPVRGGNTGTKIDTAKGLEYSGIEDVEFLRDLMLAALKVPKSFLNYSDELAGKSTISAIDLIFSRVIEYIQKCVVGELTKIAMAHLYVQGFEEDLNNFELRLNNPSIIYEQERIALLKEKIALAKEMQESHLFSSDRIYDKVYELSEDQVMIERELVLEDAKRKFQIDQIESEGNDPGESGESYGTPHDLASIYKQNQYGKGIDKKGSNVPDEYDETKNIPGPGRPKEKASIYKTDKSYAGRDPIGAKGMKDKDADQSITYKDKPKGMTMEINHPKNKVLFSGLTKYKKKDMLTEGVLSDEGLLSEANILDDINI